ncbi:hypothetical protein CJD36_007970 [Flavipsychrobacter stenotrophus]|uniref:Uncharacterized protein n=2 Tax=Flavipsychrobacter stenotrophus TaxID=2077091 RepID=A0A2S7SXR9_9BACT|nr:hypothetical protein CJD36_007970 [Flavipsychrobacter stenotrophus]
MKCGTDCEIHLTNQTTFMKKIIVAATMVGALLTTTMANAQSVIKTKKVSKTEMQQTNTAAAKKQTKVESDTKTLELKTTENGTKTRTTTHKSKVVKTTKETKAVMTKK